MKPDRASLLFNAIVPAPFGALGIRTADDKVCELVYLPPSFAEKSADSALAGQAAQQVARYLQDPDAVFDLPLLDVGTEFQRKVWQHIHAIPRGAVRTYGHVARVIGSAPRAVGQACGAN
ncbi:MAG: MGMT family protein, partial [Janthinobacterium sp.]